MKWIVGLLLFSLHLSASAQEEVEEPKNRLTFMMSHTYVPVILNGEDKEWGAVPSLGLNYDYWVSESVGLGIHSDFLLENFFIEEFEESKALEREKPFAMVAVFLYKFENELTTLIAFGAEIEKSKSLMLAQFGLEYGKAFGKNWEVGGNLTYDLKFEAYNSFTLGLSISKIF